ncbi:hypothetical protein BCV70DRAFT_73694 [Testicularia cyperi]|uniref:Hydrophobin n=1 Tax=Testicularia cyperi TaxID=1882483 RepID=A0A317XST4_9BASI|nr:hypothetical protein BCV70DRAFT_73694 [Testicularia cyperi]
MRVTQLLFCAVVATLTGLARAGKGGQYDKCQLKGFATSGNMYGVGVDRDAGCSADKKLHCCVRRKEFDAMSTTGNNIARGACQYKSDSRFISAKGWVCM